MGTSQPSIESRSSRVAPWWSSLLLVAGCQLGGVSAGISSDPVGPSFDTSSLGPPGGGRTGQMYGKSGRARLKASAGSDAETKSPDAPRQRTAATSSQTTAGSRRGLDRLNDPNESSDSSREPRTAQADTTPSRRALPASAEEPETLGTSPKPRAIRTIPVDESDE
jgi:hypothetical protein